MEMPHTPTSAQDRGGTSTMTQKCVGMRSDTYPREPLWSTFAFAGWSSLISRSPDNYLLLPQPQQIVGWTCKCVRDVLQFCLNEIGPNLNRFPGANAKVWMEDFRHRLRIRQQGHHARCSVCIRHRLIIRRLGRGPARLAQLEQYKAHLGRQYRDRQVYWSHRARSRSEATSGAPVTHISMICDGMDQAKHAYPKGEAINAKEFASWVRPRLQATTIIAHGHAILVGLSPQNTLASGSRTMELVAYMMTKQLHYIHWPAVFLHLEADNCSRELKHQTGLRMMSTLIALHRLRGCEFNYLSTGHSHEDIDAHFSLTSSYLDRFRELHNISDFQKTLQKMFENRSIRVNEPSREVTVFDSFHDWPFNRIGIIFTHSHCLEAFPTSSDTCTRAFGAGEERALCSLPSGIARKGHRRPRRATRVAFGAAG